MADTVTPKLGLTKPGVKDPAGVGAWGGKLNTNFDILDNAYTTPAALLAAINSVDGVGSGLDADLLDGQSGAYYLARANHTGTQVWSTITGTPTTIAGYGITDAYDKTTSDARFINVAGDTMTGTLTLAADPALALQAATKQYVDAKPAGAVISDTPPGSPSQGQTWWESDTGGFYISYNDGNTTQWVQINGTSSGNVAGPASSTDNALARYDLASGKIIQNSNALLDDPGNLTLVGSMFAANFIGTAATTIFTNAGAGTLLLRPNGSGSSTGQASLDSVGAFTTSSILAGSVSLPQTNALIKTRGTTGNSIEWGHGNAGGYGSTLGYYAGSGYSYVGFHCEAGSTNNTFLTRGLKGSVFRSDANGGFIWATVPAASADNQTPSQLAALDYAGNFAVAGWSFTGGVLYNTLVPSSACAMRATFTGAGSQYGLILYSGSVAASNQVLFYNGTSPGTQVGSIVTTNSATAYNTSSDERLKDFIGVYDPQKAIDIIRADPVRDWNWTDGSGYAVGWGAQTSYAVSPDLASPPAGDDTKEVQPEPGEEGFQPWGMDQAKRTPYLWAALAAALDKIDALEARLAVLEGAR
jgi:hypothetical protein